MRRIARLSAAAAAALLAPAAAVAHDNGGIVHVHIDGAAAIDAWDIALICAGAGLLVAGAILVRRRLAVRGVRK